MSHNCVGVITDITATEIWFEFQDPETKSKSVGSVKVEDVVGKSKALTVGDKLNCDIEKQVSSCCLKTT